MIDALTDGFRWWGSMGAILAIGLMAHWYAHGLTVLDFGDRRIAAITMFLAMFAIVLAGAVIPWASDGRIEGFTQRSLGYRAIMMVAWGCWSLSAWSAAVALTKRKREMLCGGISWIVVCFVAAEETAGGML